MDYKCGRLQRGLPLFAFEVHQTRLHLVFCTPSTGSTLLLQRSVAGASREQRHRHGWPQLVLHLIICSPVTSSSRTGPWPCASGTALCIMRWCDDCMDSRRRVLIAHPKHGTRHISPSSRSRIRRGRLPVSEMPAISAARRQVERNEKRAAKEGANLGDDEAPREDINVVRFLPLLCRNHDGDDVCSAARRPPQASELAAWHCAKRQRRIGTPRKKTANP